MFTVGPVAENTYIFRRDGSDRALIVDPGEEAPKLLNAIEQLGVTLDGILLTMLEDGNAVSQRVAAYVREQLPKELLFDVAIPRTMASIDAFAAGQPVVLRSPDDPASRAYTRLAELLDRTLQ